MTTIDLTISNDLMSLGEGGTEADLAAFAAQLGDELGQEHDCEVRVKLANVGRADAHGDDTDLAERVLETYQEWCRSDRWAEVLKRALDVQAAPDAEDAATAALELNEQLTHRGFETLTAAELRSLADSDEGLDTMIDDLHKTSPLPSDETGAVLPAYRAEVRGVLRDWLQEQAEERAEIEALPREYVVIGDDNEAEIVGIDTDEDMEAAKAQLLAHGILSAPVYRGHGADQVKTSLVLFARGDDAEVWRC